MPFHPPSWSPQLREIPDSISIERFMFDETYGRHPLRSSHPPFLDVLSGREHSYPEVKERVEFLARALCKTLGFRPDQGSEWDKVVGIFSLNTIDYLTVAWAVHRIGGVATCVNAAYNASELEYQMNDSGARAIFTCLPLLQTCRDGVKKSKMPNENIFVLPLPDQVTGSAKNTEHETIEDLIELGKSLPAITPSDETWKRGHGKERTAFLCYSSGTSGLPKGVMISHFNVIANTLQAITHESPDREEQARKLGVAKLQETALGLLPMSHIYGLIVGSHVGPYRGDRVVVLPKYDFKWLLEAIQSQKINMLYLVPPMIIHIIMQKETVKKYDLSSVRSIFTGAAPLGKETAEQLVAMFPDWKIRQGYGLTETSTVVCSTVASDVWFGSSGPLLPGVTARLVTVEGNEITGHDQPGELWVKSPSVVLGYKNNDKATRETFVDEKDGRYMRTGDEAVIRKGPQGHEHVFIVDRLKELIKVKGFQVAPAELEAHLLTHPAVSDCVVVGVSSDREGEVPKAFVVKAPGSIEESDAIIKRQIMKHVEQHKADYKRLRGGVEFIDAVPKSPSGKILRRLIRDREKEKSRKQGAKL